MSRVSSFRVLVCALVLAAVATPGLLPAQTESPFYGRTQLTRPERTDAGDWYGTWYYISRSRKMALWIRTKDGQPEVKLRLQERASSRLSFTTDWDTRADYNHSGVQGQFSLDIENRDENTITGKWIWDSRTSAGGSGEAAEFTIYRSGYGRQLVMHLQNVEHKQVSRTVQRLPELVWTFKKASRRTALWGELPF